jgi:8-oxo-dGTP pyrophosphatase MutT (NUDIX family)
MKRGEIVTGQPLRLPSDTPATRYLPLAQLRSLKGRTQVAAVCYRVHKGTLEFLLVATRGDRWTFPKGSAEAGLTHAQAAALEAFEEAGVHGRMEEASFASYSRPGSAVEGSGRAALVVHAHLCEVSWLEEPQEEGRNPTWFPTEKAKRKVREERSRGYGDELARILDEAAARIRRLRSLRSAYSYRTMQVIDIGSARKGQMQRAQFTVRTLKKRT